MPGTLSGEFIPTMYYNFQVDNHFASHQRIIISLMTFC